MYQYPDTQTLHVALQALNMVFYCFFYPVSLIRTYSYTHSLFVTVFGRSREICVMYLFVGFDQPLSREVRGRSAEHRRGKDAWEY